MPADKQTSDLIRAIQDARSSRVICLLTSDRLGLSQSMGMMQADALRHIYDLARETWARKSSDRLDLFIYTRGGDSDVPWALMSMLREVVGQKKEINALIPYRCHSAGTISVLGADNIVMGPKAELGPIDTTMNTPFNPQHPKTGEPLPISVEDVMGYFSMLERVGCTGSDSKIEGLKQFTRKVHPYALGMIQRLEDQTKLVAGQMLDSRLLPFSVAENEAIVSTLAKRINSHRHAISRTEAIRQIGLKNIARAEDVKLDKPLWDLFLAYEKKLELENPFYPEDDFWKDDTLEEKEYLDLRCCYVETEWSARICKFDVKMTRVRETIQSLTIQPQISFPPPPLPAGLNQAQFDQFIQSWYNAAAPALLQRAVTDAMDQARKAAPTKGFQRIEHRRRWETEPATPSNNNTIKTKRKLSRAKKINT